MKTHYDFSWSIKNPYTRRLKKRITIRLDSPTVDCFKALAAETGLPYQNLINLFLRQSAQEKRRLTATWG